MRSTEASEAAEIQAAETSLALAREWLAAAHQASVQANASPLDALAHAEDAERARVALAQERLLAAYAARKSGREKRARGQRWRSAWGVRPPEAPSPPHAPADAFVAARRATAAFVGGLGPHRQDEDIHPARLDASESDLEDALARLALEKKNAERDARDA